MQRANTLADTPSHPDYIPDVMCRVLVVAYYFPPMGLSGVQRVAKFVKYLRAYNWEPTVLTVEPRGYFAFDDSLLDELERADIEIRRVPSADPTTIFRPRERVAFPSERRRRFMSLISQALFVPDNKRGWIRPAVAEGIRILDEKRFDAVFSTAPPYSAHLVGLQLSQYANLPLITDFRDDWVGNPRHRYVTPWHRSRHEALERRVTRNSHAITTINRRIQDRLVARNLGAAGFNRVFVLPQGYDPEDFPLATVAPNKDRMTFLYTGMFYDTQRPDTFLIGLARAMERVPEMRGPVCARFVGLFPEKAKELLTDLGLNDVVELDGYLPHRRTVERMLEADILWMTIGSAPGNETISTGKVHEYMGTRKPILGLVPEGAARDVLLKYGAAILAHPEDADETSRAIESLYRMWRDDALPAADEAFVHSFDRQAITRQLASILSRASHIDTVL
jgi:glycosyltransferase involved in cell wall biosynthesis